jgi:hypothetical protein
MIGTVRRAGGNLHEAVAQILTNEQETLVTTELVVAEADYLERLGLEVELDFRAELARGTSADPRRPELARITSAMQIFDT